MQSAGDAHSAALASATLYALPMCCMQVSLAAAPDGDALVSGHLDASLQRFVFPPAHGGAGPGRQQAPASLQLPVGHVQLVAGQTAAASTSGCDVAYALAWAQGAVAVGGSNNVVCLGAWGVGRGPLLQRSSMQQVGCGMGCQQ